MKTDLTHAEGVTAIVRSFDCSPSNLIAIMQEIQAQYKYLSEEALTVVAELLGISIAEVYINSTPLCFPR